MDSNRLFKVGNERINVNAYIGSIHIVKHSSRTLLIDYSKNSIAKY